MSNTNKSDALKNINDIYQLCKTSNRYTSSKTWTLPYVLVTHSRFFLPTWIRPLSVEIWSCNSGWKLNKLVLKQDNNPILFRKRPNLSVANRIRPDSIVLDPIMLRLVSSAKRSHQHSNNHVMAHTNLTIKVHLKTIIMSKTVTVKPKIILIYKV